MLLVLQFNLLANEELPLWIEKDPDNRGIYFRGVSTWYVSDDARTRGLSKRDALEKAYSLVSDYFGLNIAATSELKEDNEHIRMKSNIKTKTNQLIFDLKPQKSFIEFSEDEESYREYILILLDKATEVKIRQEMKKDQQEYKVLKARVLQLMQEKHYFRAKNILELAKGKRSAFMDSTITSIEARLQNLIDGEISTNLSIDKKTYKPDEAINLEVSLNKDGYLYLFYVTSSDVEMIYPNKYQRSSYIKKAKTILFPNDSVETLVAYEEDLNKKVQFYAIASKKNLGLKRYALEQIDGAYLYNKQGEYLNIIQKCIENSSCTKHVVNFNISDKVDSNLASVNIIADNVLKTSLEKYFKSKGISTKASEKQITYTIHKDSSYSQSLEMQIVSFNITASLYKNSRLITKRQEDCDEDEIADYLYDIYQELEGL